MDRLEQMPGEAGAEKLLGGFEPAGDGDDRDAGHARVGVGADAREKVAEMLSVPTKSLRSAVVSGLGSSSP